MARSGRVELQTVSPRVGDSAGRRRRDRLTAPERRTKRIHFASDHLLSYSRDARRQDRHGAIESGNPGALGVVAMDCMPVFFKKYGRLNYTQLSLTKKFLVQGPSKRICLFVDGAFLEK
ncbi:hypothetical protein BA177_17655 [Woeseia oceani]|uniref:Uncharacterized protein n=1 Tax=Woeseia oceani TaxID=1548547 RepID=A0A193LJQ2_9GAMM|nr:hypothetical protein BA177_17655 [Woeseia oceani]